MQAVARNILGEESVMHVLDNVLRKSIWVDIYEAFTGYGALRPYVEGTRREAAKCIKTRNISHTAGVFPEAQRNTGEDDQDQRFQHT